MYFSFSILYHITKNLANFADLMKPQKYFFTNNCLMCVGSIHVFAKVFFHEKLLLQDL